MSTNQSAGCASLLGDGTAQEPEPLLAVERVEKLKKEMEGASLKARLGIE